MNDVFLLTGGNIGDRIKNLASAEAEINRFAGVVIDKSSIYETAAWGLEDQQPFLNQVLKITTNLSPHQLLKTILSIEKHLGRERLQKMGPRTIDIDILFYGNEIIATPDLQIPHAEIANRRFVLTPLNEIAAAFIHPALKVSVATLLEQCKDTLEVERFNA